ncbi:CLUMA_CG014882, isoform A [Clunio marinus]|uniref:CLUMA_CG014882, isoform A n=1 Tax=Clunio marinus TaxID=568069 RepID=A0A1J1IQ47_9DIPT|nr:CLUMA_CG014882, isoform A [Clunio marinus]
METFLQSKEIKIPKPLVKSNKMSPSKIEFKSSFARSLSYNCNYHENHNEESKSLDFEINLSQCPDQCNGTESDNACCDENGQKLTSSDENLGIGNFIESFNKSDEDKERQLWSKRQHQQISSDSHHNSSDAEIFRLRKECQNLIEENRRLQLNGKHPMKISSLPFSSVQLDCSSGVENVVLQTKIETLQWQLRQVESSRQMYRAIMEEVARYLEKCHLNFELLQQREKARLMERSKSITHIAKTKITDTSLATCAVKDARSRSSTNLLSVNTLTPQRPQKSGTLLSDLSYSAFKDFTWRRTPKNKTVNSSEHKPENAFKEIQAQQSSPIFVGSKQWNKNEREFDAEKLSKEAFRLSRTVQNFLNTHEPILTQTESATETNSFERTTSDHQRNDFLFGFDRESHSSLRSTDEYSVHSSSNSSNSKEEEDPAILPNTSSKKLNSILTKSATKSKRFSTCHQTEDESGFSSMNSFHEIGLPLHSTMLSLNTSILSTSANESASDTLTFKKDELKDDIGLPMSPATKLPNNHRKYDSAPITQISKMKILENDENSMKVLWV